MVTLNVLWIAIDPLSSVTEPALNHPEVLTWQFCQGGSNVYVWLGLVIGYCAIILAYGVYLAVKTSDVPGSFNESKVRHTQRSARNARHKRGWHTATHWQTEMS